MKSDDHALPMRIVDPRNHPELGPGEEWVINVSEFEDLKKYKKYGELIRFGTIAYNLAGDVVNGYRPLFVLNERARASLER